MNYLKIIIDGLICSLLFNGSAYLLLRKNVRYFMDDLPKKLIQKLPAQTKQEKHEKFLIFGSAWVLIILYQLVSLYFAYKTHNSFKMMFLHVYIIWNIISLTDLLSLDVAIWCIIKPKFRIVPGTEGDSIYKPAQWMKRVALPEHLLLWPLILAPALSLLISGLVKLISMMIPAV